jgi:hypothetical protein
MLTNEGWPPPEQAFSSRWQVDEAGLLHFGGAAALVAANDQDLVVEIRLFPGQAAELAGPDAGEAEEEKHVAE